MSFDVLDLLEQSCGCDVCIKMKIKMMCHISTVKIEFGMMLAFVI